MLGVGASRSAGQMPPPSPILPIGIDATIATIPVGSVPAGVGIQGIALNVDRSLLYVAEGTRTTQWNGERCAPAPPPQSGSAGAVGVFNTNLLTKVAEVALSAGFPIHVELDTTTGRLYVATSPDWVYALDGTAQVASVRLGGVPHDIGVDPAAGRGVVTNTNALTGVQTYVALIDLGTLQPLRHIDTRGFGPHKAAVDPERHLVYVSHAEFEKVDVIDSRTGDLLRQIPTGLARGGAQNAIDVARRRLYVVGAAPSGTTAALVAIDLQTEQSIGEPLLLPFGGHGMRVDPETGMVWVVLEEQGQVAVIDPQTLTEQARIAVGHCPYYLDIDPFLRRAYVTNQGDNAISIVDMTRAGGPTALDALNRLAARAADNSADAIRALTDRVIDYAGAHRAVDESVRERLARAEENFRFGWHAGITEEMAADAIRPLIPAVDLPLLRSARDQITSGRPHLASAAGGLSPVEALLLVETVTHGALFPGHDLLTALRIRR